MGTFHQDKHELHGITVVVDTVGDEVYIGRCDDMNEKGILLLDVDVHKEGAEGRTKAEYVERAAQVGIWTRFPRVLIPGPHVASVRRLGDL